MKIKITLLILIVWATASADRFEYTGPVNQLIPVADSAGVRDTIFIDQHVLIEDINFYVGMGQSDQPWAEHILIDVFSPSRQAVRLNDWGPPSVWLYNFWYDTDHVEDGPGRLENYAGQDAYGEWEMFCFHITDSNTLYWREWRIEIIGTPITGLAEEDKPLPTDFEFSGVYPNPFNSTVSLEYGLPQASEVTFTVYDIQGRKIRKIDCGTLSAGYHNVIWVGADMTGEPVASGSYFVRMSAGNREFTRTAVMLK